MNKNVLRSFLKMSTEVACLIELGRSFQSLKTWRLLRLSKIDRVVLKNSVAFFVQGLLKKHQAFETDLEVHRERVQDIENDGNQLIEKVCSV